MDRTRRQFRPALGIPEPSASIGPSGEFDVARQQDQVKDFIVKRVAAIVLCPCDSRSIGPAIQEANAAGVPVFTADIACLAPGVEVRVISLAPAWPDSMTRPNGGMRSSSFAAISSWSAWEVQPIVASRETSCG